MSKLVAWGTRLPLTLAGDEEEEEAGRLLPLTDTHLPRTRNEATGALGRAITELF